MGVNRSLRNSASARTIALPPSGASVDRTQSPVAVSRKREYFSELPETFGDLALQVDKMGV